MKFILFLPVIFLASSCSSSMIGVGLSHDTGTIVPVNNKEVASDLGYFIEYRWKRMSEKEGYGIDINFHQNGYGPIGDSDGFPYKSLQGKYYRSIAGSPSNFINLDGALGLGLGSGTTIDGFLLVSNVSLDLNFLRNNVFYLSPKLNYILNTNHWGYNVSFEIGLGVRLRK